MSAQEGDVEAIVGRQRTDLIAYLTRVKNLSPPTADLVFMHSEAGVASGLEATTSERLATLARNGQVKGLNELLADLSPAKQRAAVGTLARWSETFRLAPERRNALTVLLAAAVAVEDLDATRTAQVAGAVLAAPDELPAGAIADTVRLAGRCAPAQRRRLVAGLGARDDVVGDAEARTALVAGFPGFENADHLYGMAGAMAIGHSDDGALGEILNLPEADQTKLLDLTAPTVLSWIETAREEAEIPSEGEQPGDTTSVNGWLLPTLEILEGSKVALARLCGWLMMAGNPPADEAVEKRLGVLAPVSDPELTMLMLERMRARPLTSRAAWLEAIDPAGIDQPAAAELDAAARQLWRERTEDEYDADDFAEAIEGLATLARSLSPEERDFPNLEAAIGDSTAAPMQDDATAMQRAGLSGAGAEFVERELADTTATADRFILSARGAMEVLTPGDLDHLPLTRAAVHQFLADWLEDASPSALEALRAASIQNPEFQLDATKAEALIGTAGRLREGGMDLTPPLDPAALGALGRDYGERADAAVLAWLAYFGDLWSVLEPLWPTPISPAQRAGFERAAKQLPSPSREGLAEAAFDHSLATSAPPPGNWDAIALRELSGAWVVGALAKRRPEGEDLERWRVLLEIARQRVLGGKAKVPVADQLLGPLARLASDPALELALDNLELASRPAAEAMLADLDLTEGQAEMVRAKIKQLDWKKGGLSGFLRDLTGSG